MLDRPTNPLEIARRILKPETIAEVKSVGFGNSVFLILDRWALNSPDRLKQLEERGDLAFIVQLDQQDTIERRTLTSVYGFAYFCILFACYYVFLCKFKNAVLKALVTGKYFSG